MQHAHSTRIAAPLAACALAVLASCATHSDPQDTASAPDRASSPELSEQEACVPDSEPVAFEPTESYGGHIRLPADSAVVVDQPAYQTIVDRLPEKKVTKRHPPPDSDDPLLEMPPIDFDEQMLVVAVCPTYYCTIEFVGMRDACDRRIVVVELPGEGEKSEYYARPYGIGNYRALRVPRLEGPFEFEYRGPGRRPETSR